MGLRAQRNVADAKAWVLPLVYRPQYPSVIASGVHLDNIRCLFATLARPNIYEPRPSRSRVRVDAGFMEGYCSMASYRRSACISLHGTTDSRWMHLNCQALKGDMERIQGSRLHVDSVSVRGVGLGGIQHIKSTANGPGSFARGTCRYQTAGPKNRT